MVLILEKLSQFGRLKSHPRPNLAQERESTLVELGGYLRQTRLQHDLSIEEVGMRTMIPVRILKAIEEGKMERLPEPVYVQAFIRRYADSLGLNGAEFSSTFPTTTGLNTESKKGIQWPGFSLGILQPIHLYVLYIVLIALAVSSLSARFNSSPLTSGQTPESPAPQDAVPRSPALQSPTAPRPSTSTSAQVSTPPKPQVSAPPSVASPTSNAIAGIDAKVTLKAESWLQVNADGEMVYEGVLAPGTTQNWKAKKTLEVVAGNAGGVMVAVNGQPPKPIGEDGEVQSATFNASSDATAPVSAPTEDPSEQP